MADWFIDHGCTLYPSAYMSVPTGAGSLPQDGDGLTAAGAPAVSSTSVDLTTATATAGATISVMGATLTCVASGATTVQFNAGVGATLAMNLAAAINAATALPTTSTGGLSLYLKALVWASATGAVLTVYSRIASPALNQTANASCIIIAGTLANWTNPPATVNFAGGVSGPWGSFWNTAVLAASINGSISAVGSYGGFVVTAMGLPAGGDTVFIRSSRSAADIKVTMPTTSLTVLARPVGTVLAPLTFLADAGIKWAGDSGVFTISLDGSMSANRYVQATNGFRHIWAGVDLTDTACNWRFEITGVPQVSNYYFGIGLQINTAMPIDINSIEITGAAGAPINNLNSSYNYVVILGHHTALLQGKDNQALIGLRNLRFKTKGSAGLFGGTGGSTSYLASYRALGCIFDHTGLTAVSTQALFMNSGAGALNQVRFEAEQCQWLGFPAVANQSGVQLYSGNRIAVSLRDCTFDNIKMLGGTSSGGLLGATDAGDNLDWLRSIQVVSSLGSRPFIFENSRRSFGWVDSAAPKVLSSRLPDGVTSFSIRGAVTTEAGIVAIGRPVIFPRLAKINSLADGSRTATLRILVDNGIKTANGARDPYNTEFWVIVGYVGVDGLPKRVSSRAIPGASPVSIPTGTASDWTATSYDVNGVTHSYSAYAISVALPNVKTLTDLGLELHQAVQSASVDNLVFIDPEWSLV